MCYNPDFNKTDTFFVVFDKKKILNFFIVIRAYIIIIYIYVLKGRIHFISFDDENSVLNKF